MKELCSCTNAFCWTCLCFCKGSCWEGGDHESPAQQYREIQTKHDKGSQVSVAFIHSTASSVLPHECRGILTQDAFLKQYYCLLQPLGPSSGGIWFSHTGEWPVCLLTSQRTGKGSALPISEPLLAVPPGAELSVGAAKWSPEQLPSSLPFVQMQWQQGEESNRVWQSFPPPFPPPREKNPYLSDV